MRVIGIGNIQFSSFRLKSGVIAVTLAIMGIGNAIASVAEWHGTTGMLIFNGACVVPLVVAVMAKIFTMEPRKMWRMLAFVLSVSGILAVFCSSFLESEIEPWLAKFLLALGSLLLILGGVSMVRWRRFSFARKEQLQNSRKKR